jgi:hypothetical protein
VTLQFKKEKREEGKKEEKKKEKEFFAIDTQKKSQSKHN